MVGPASDHQLFPSYFSGIAWNPKAIEVDDEYPSGLRQGSPGLLEALPKIPQHEAALQYDLWSRIFVFDPTKRPTARDMLSHLRVQLSRWGNIPWVGDCM